jgi:hypothetical protein
VIILKNVDQKALEITTQIALAQIQNSQPIVPNEGAGKAIAEYFKAIYNGVKDVTLSIQD